MVLSGVQRRPRVAGPWVSEGIIRGLSSFRRTLSHGVELVVLVGVCERTRQHGSCNTAAHPDYGSRARLLCTDGGYAACGWWTLAVGGNPPQWGRARAAAWLKVIVYGPRVCIVDRISGRSGVRVRGSQCRKQRMLVGASGSLIPWICRGPATRFVPSRETTLDCGILRT